MLSWNKYLCLENGLNLKDCKEVVLGVVKEFYCVVGVALCVCDYKIKERCTSLHELYVYHFPLPKKM